MGGPSVADLIVRGHGAALMIVADHVGHCEGVTRRPACACPHGFASWSNWFRPFQVLRHITTPLMDTLLQDLGYWLDAGDAVVSTCIPSSGACESVEAFCIGGDLTDSDIGVPHHGLKVKSLDRSTLDEDSVGDEMQRGLWRCAVCRGQRRTGGPVYKGHGERPGR